MVSLQLCGKVNSKRITLLIIACSLLLPLLFSCGKKSPPSLKVFEKPAAPSEMQVVRREDMLILSWAYPNNLRQGIKGFYILRSENGGFERIAFIGSDGSSYADRDFRLNASYKYETIAVSRKDVLSDASKVITVTPVPLPSPPGKITSAVKQEAVELSWDSSGSGVCYQIYKSAKEGIFEGAPLNDAPVCATSFRDTAIMPDVPVYYTLRPFVPGEIPAEGYASAEVEVAPSAFVPSPPSDLRIARGDNVLFLSWKESPESWVKGYRVYRREGGETEFILAGEVKTPAFVDSRRTDKKVRYRIRAFGPAAESAPLEGE